MQIQNYHISYCTNIHAGESFEEVFDSLKTNLLPIKNSISTNKPFGVGLRLSNQTVQELLVGNRLCELKNWLIDNDFYVFTGNAFPYGDFHQTVIKEKVHFPDWLSQDRVEYTCNYAKIMAQLPNIGNEQCISTSPLSYKFWHSTNDLKINAYKVSAKNLLKIVIYLKDLEHTTGKYIHLAIEPEPDGLLENSTEFITFYYNYLLPEAKFQNIATESVKKYITLCYDVCHFAVMFENHQLVLDNNKIRN